MHNICDLSTITWTSPFSRFTWEGVCGMGGPLLAVFIGVLIGMWIISKLVSSK